MKGLSLIGSLCCQCCSMTSANKASEAGVSSEICQSWVCRWEIGWSHPANALTLGCPQRRPPQGTPMTFWRMMPDEPCRHRNPLWDPAMGITTEILCIDTLHTLALGFFGSFVARAFWFLMEASPFNVSTLLSQEERHQRTLQLLTPQLRAFYRGVGRKWTQVGRAQARDIWHQAPSPLPPQRAPDLGHGVLFLKTCSQICHNCPKARRGRSVPLHWCPCGRV